MLISVPLHPLLIVSDYYYINKKWKKTLLFTSLIGHSWDRRSCSSFWSSFRVPSDCWTLRKSESSFRPASVKYLAKWSTFCRLAGNSSWKERNALCQRHNQLWPFTEWKEHSFTKEHWESPGTALRVNACLTTAKVNSSFILLYFIRVEGKDDGQLCKNP